MKVSFFFYCESPVFAKERKKHMSGERVPIQLFISII